MWVWWRTLWQQKPAAMTSPATDIHHIFWLNCVINQEMLIKQPQIDMAILYPATMCTWTSLYAPAFQSQTMLLYVLHLYARLHPPHLALLVLVLVGVLALALPPQLLQVWLGFLQGVLLHLVLHLIPLKCGLEQKKEVISAMSNFFLWKVNLPLDRSLHVTL